MLAKARRQISLSGECFIGAYGAFAWVESLCWICDAKWQCLPRLFYTSEQVPFSDPCLPRRENPVTSTLVQRCTIPRCWQVHYYRVSANSIITLFTHCSPFRSEVVLAWKSAVSEFWECIACCPALSGPIPPWTAGYKLNSNLSVFFGLDTKSDNSESGENKACWWHYSTASH